MAIKTTKHAKMMIENFNRQLEYRNQFINDGMTNHSVFLEGMSLMVSQTLIDMNCYHGFQFLDKNLEPCQDSSETWRVSFIIKE